jgi:hypothetical protein
VTPELAAVSEHLDRHLVRAHFLFARAETRCEAARAGAARRGLRLVRRRLGRVGHMLERKAVRGTVSALMTDPIAHEAAALALDVRTLAATLVCR